VDEPAAMGELSCHNVVSWCGAGTVVVGCSAPKGGGCAIAGG